MTTAGPTLAGSADVGQPHDGCDAFAAGQHALIGKLRTDTRHAVGGIARGMSHFNVRQQCYVGRSTFAWRTPRPVVVTAGRDLEVFAHGVDR